MDVNDEGKRLIRPGKDTIKLARMYEVAQIIQMMFPYLNENQFAAVVSFAYDVTLQRFKRSKLRRLLEEGEYFLAAREIEDWQYKTDKPTKQRRRRAEKRLFLKPVLIKHSGDITPIR